MSVLNNPMAVFKLLPKTNCRECGERTCLAFAAAVFKGTRDLAECPYLDKAVIEQYGGRGKKGPDIDQSMDEAVRALREKIKEVDLASVAERLGGEYRNGRLTLRTLGKPFSIDDQGKMHADIHIHGWIAIPMLRYVLESKGEPLTGRWVPLRELKGGQDWHRLFEQRGEKAIKYLADNYSELFEDMTLLFNGQETSDDFNADIAVVLYPLPKVPMMICYWKPDEGMASSLNVFFDESAPDNLPIDALYSLTAGFVRMLEKISHRHGIRSATG